MNPGVAALPATLATAALSATTPAAPPTSVFAAIANAGTAPSSRDNHANAVVL